MEQLCHYNYAFIIKTTKTIVIKSKYRILRIILGLSLLSIVSLLKTVFIF